MATAMTAVIGVNIRSTSEKTLIPTPPVGGISRESTSRDVYIEEQSDPTYTFGVGPNQAKGHFHGTWSVANNAQVTFDVEGLRGTPIADVFGDQIDAIEIKAIFLHNLSTTPGDLLTVLGDTPPTGFSTLFMLVCTDAVNLGPDGVLLLTSPVDGFAVGDQATDEIEIRNDSGNTIEFEIYILYVD